MAGHSQFKNIMHRKGAQDRERARIFSRLAREITVAAKTGLPDPAMNPRLRSAIIAARAENMPKDNIERAIKKGSPGVDNTVYEEVRYEGFGPGNVAVIVEALTDNRARTAPNVRSIFSKRGGIMGEMNSVSFNFERVGLVHFPASAASADAMFEAALNAGAADVASDEDGHDIYCSPDDLGAVREALEKAFGTPEAARLSWKTLTSVPLDDEEKARAFFAFMEALNEDDDVQRIYANYDIPAELLARIEAE